MNNPLLTPTQQALIEVLTEAFQAFCREHPDEDPQFLATVAYGMCRRWVSHCLTREELASLDSACDLLCEQLEEHLGQLS